MSQRPTGLVSRDECMCVARFPNGCMCLVCTPGPSTAHTCTWFDGTRAWLHAYAPYGTNLCRRVSRRVLTCSRCVPGASRHVPNRAIVQKTLQRNGHVKAHAAYTRSSTATAPACAPCIPFPPPRDAHTLALPCHRLLAASPAQCTARTPAASPADQAAEPPLPASVRIQH